MQRFRLDLFPSKDSDGQIFYVGRFQAPMSINLSKGVAFLIYPEMEVPELHIGPLDSPDLSSVFDYYNKRDEKLSKTKHGNIPISLTPRFSLDKNRNNRKFYVGKLKLDATIDASEGLVFLVFLCDEGDEELQIAGVNIAKLNKKKHENIKQFERFDKR